ncbi:MAG TPA: AraC family ligand binding domain-containing protein, partial [Synergistaceae bacterium]|nr:AraC family ligand binding domain-containing protein [Synergistaceae bacterium]
MRGGEESRGKLFQVPLDASESVRALWGEGIRHIFRRHFHSSLCVGLVEEGVRSLSFRGVTYELRPGTLFLLPPGEPHQCRCFAEKGHAYR